MIALLIAILILVVVLWAVSQLLPMAGLPQPVHTVVYVIIVVIALIWFINRITGIGL